MTANSFLVTKVMGNQGPIGGNSGLPYWATYPTVWTGYNPVTEYPNPPAG